MDTALLVLGSASIAALISSIINAVANHITKLRELHTRDLEFALGLTRLKNEQLFHISAGERAAGRAFRMEFHDPLVSTVEYLHGLKEYRSTGTWEKAEKSHAKTDT